MKKAVRYITWTAIICAVLMIAYLAVVDNVEFRESRSTSSIRFLNEYVYNEKISEEAPAGIVREYSITVPKNVVSGSCLGFFTSHQSVRIEMDGEEIYSVFPAEKNKLAKTTGSRWNAVPIYEDDIGKMLLIEITPAYSSVVSKTPKFYVGSEAELITGQIKSDLPQYLLGLIAVFLGIVFYVMGLALKKSGGRAFDKLTALGSFSCVVGLWRLTDINSNCFIADKTVMLAYISLILLALGILPFIKMMRQREHEEDKSKYDIMSCICCGVFLLQVALGILGIAEMREFLSISHMMLVVLLSALLIVYLRENRKTRKGNYSHKVSRIPIICVFGAALDVVKFYITDSSSGLVFTLTALLIYISHYGINVLLEVNRQAAELEEQRRLAIEHKLAIAISQIQPHFLYNSIAAIQELCRKEPEMAREALGDFATYLRGNMDSLTVRKPVPFSWELKHVENYLRLEKLRFGDRLNVEYEIGVEDFHIPVLTVQPLVENAIKHGVCKAENGGTVLIRTMREDQYVRIEIIDDGVGFDTESDFAAGDKKSHVGIKNVRQRLENVVSGHLEIQSDIGRGTRAVILIDAQQGEDDVHISGR